MSNRKQPETSLEAYRSLDLKELNETYRDILKSLGELGEGTFEEIAAHMKVDKSRVWKRMSELEKMELVYRPGKKKLLKSNRNGYVWVLRLAATPKTYSEVRYSQNEKTAAEHAINLIKNTNHKINYSGVQQNLFQ